MRRRYIAVLRDWRRGTPVTVFRVPGRLAVDVGRVVTVRGLEGTWRVVCIRGDEAEVIAHPWAATWAAPRSVALAEAELFDVVSAL